VVRGTFRQQGPYLAPRETLVHGAGVPRGQVTARAAYTSRSAYPGWSFEYSIYVPAQFDPKRPAALMVFQDGAHYLGLTAAKFNSATTFDNLIASNELPVTIALFVDPGTPSGKYRYPADKQLRSLQYDALDDTYSRFLLDELIPDSITSRFNIVPEPDGWAIAGHSSGGICAFTVAWRKPDKFRKVLTHNGSFVDLRGGHVYLALVRESAVKPLRVMLLSGSGDTQNAHGSWLEANQAMAAALEEKQYDYRFMTGAGQHYPPLQAVADYPDALRWLWRGYTLSG
jgi:enterochelin esterase family protein